MMLTATQILNDMRSELCGTVKLAFQPAEEIAVGAKAMIADGALEGVEGCFAIHVWTDVPSGHVCCKAGPEWRPLTGSSCSSQARAATEPRLIGASTPQWLQRPL